MNRIPHTGRWHDELVDLKSHTDWSLVHVIAGLFLLQDPYSQLAASIEWKRRYPSADHRCGSKRWAGDGDRGAEQALAAADPNTIARVTARLDAPDAPEVES